MKETLIRDCECWEHSASLNFVDRGIPKEAIRHIYCPRCSKGIKMDEECMAEEKGWLIEFDPNLVRCASSSIRLIQNREKIGSLLIYTERKSLLKNDF